MYGKIFASMFDGSLYGNWKAIVTFQQMIILCNQDGVVDMTPQALAARTSIPLDIIQEGIAVLEAPDKYSRSREHDGRRIERLDDERPWGWRLINYRKYRLMVSAEEKREADRARIAAKRAAERAKKATGSDETRQSQESQKVANVAQAEAEVEVKRERDASRPPAPRKASRLPYEDIPAGWSEYCRENRPDLDPARVWEDFRDYWLAASGPKAAKRDWDATWRRWVRNEKQGARPQQAEVPWYRQLANV